MTQPVDAGPPRSVARRVAGFAVGVALLAAAIVAVATQRDQLGSLFDRATHAPWWIVAALFVLPICNWLLVAGSFHLLIQRFGRVELGEMTSLVGSAWLLNYLPLRPGLIGRVTYHKTVNNIRVRDSAAVLIVSIALSGVGGLLLLGAGLLTHKTNISVAAALAAPAIIIALASAAAWMVRPGAGRVTVALLLRYLDMLVWVGRYAAVFELVGHSMPLPQIVLITAASQVAMMVPLTGNGVGLREWAVGLTAASVGGVAAAGLTADLFNRAAEVLVAIPVGLICSARVARLVAAHQSQSEDSNPQPTPID